VHYTRLEELRDRLTGDQGRMTQDARESPPGVAGMHLADAATDHYERDWTLSVLSGEQNARYEIEQAIERIRNGTYGVCELTGKPIQAERLRAIPWTRFRTEAEREVELAGAQPRTRLAGREPAEWAPEAEEPEE
jgi:RNA polymerase-binding transcription factor DksA